MTVRLRPEDRSAWLAEAREVFTERRAERDRDKLRHARGELQLDGADVEGIRRRREAARRMPPRPDGRRDPLEPAPQPPFTLAELDRWARALRHLQSVGLAGLPPAPVRCALAARPDRYGDVLPRPAA